MNSSTSIQRSSPSTFARKARCFLHTESNAATRSRKGRSSIGYNLNRNAESSLAQARIVRVATIRDPPAIVAGDPGITAGGSIRRSALS